jgi:ATP-binding cassette subfamily F protein 3
MIKLLLEPVNLLILDEPTNHLDMPSKDVLKEAIKAFDGTAIIVSHDREFLDGLVSKVYEFGHGEVREHLGGIYDYLRAHHADSIHEALNSTGSVEEKIAVKEVSTQSQQTVNKQSYAEHKEQQKKIRKVEKAIKEAEAKIESMEKRKSELDEMLMKPENASNMDLVTEYTSLQKSLDQENDHWFELSQKLEELN